jgi:hypothetical protein
MVIDRSGTKCRTSSAHHYIVLMRLAMVVVGATYWSPSICFENEDDEMSIIRGTKYKKK